MARDSQSEQIFERDLSTLPLVFDFVETYLSTNNIDASEAYAINLAVEELFTNTVKYSSATEPIRVGLSTDGAQVVIVFRDSGGTPFDVTRVADVDIDRPADEVRPGDSAFI